MAISETNKNNEYTVTIIQLHIQTAQKNFNVNTLALIHLKAVIHCCTYMSGSRRKILFIPRREILCQLITNTNLTLCKHCKHYA